MSSSAPSGVQQPPWLAPAGTRTRLSDEEDAAAKLKIYNSLTREKEVFAPSSQEASPNVGWYSCGPTVYDHSHLGHARAYITFDILRRLLKDYFGYDVLYVMNITDIDDKIIKGARFQYLFNKFRSESEKGTKGRDETIEAILTAWVAFVNKYFPEITPKELKSIDESPIAIEIVKKFFLNKELNPTVEFANRLQGEEAAAAAEADPKKEMRRKQLIATCSAIKAVVTDAGSKIVEVIDSTRDILVEYLDKRQGTTVNDPKIFREFAAYWEDQYFDDMDKLNVLRPDVLTRVSEYVPEIIEYVEGIIKNGFAYSTEDGSVYFDTTKFSKDEHHSYAKLQPWSANNTKLLSEGEGELISKDSGKKNPADFALWKSSKPGEPSWKSPWGLGRPGWHIECSAMASNVLGEKLDIHSGGIDLAFPHHDNELAQAEGYHNCDQWVNYFIHAGHLHIEGQKMSKSLKNFVTIKEALKENTAAQIRYMFLLHQWNATLDYSKGSMQEARSVEASFNNFFDNVKAIIADRELETKTSKAASAAAASGVVNGNNDQGSNNVTDEVSHDVNDAERDILRALETTGSLVHSAIRDSFNTPLVMQHLRDLVTKSNTYIADKLKVKENPSPEVLKKVAAYVTKWLRIFGVYTDSNPDVGQSDASGSGNSNDGALVYLKVLANYREKVRQIARELKSEELLKACDDLRDFDLVDVGVSLDDRGEGNQPLIKFVDREELIRRREEKERQEKEKQDAKKARLLEQEAKRLEKLSKGKISPKDLFKQRTSEFSKFDEESGLPTHDENGEELSKGKKKKLEKEYAVQEKLHKEYLAWVQEGNSL